MVRILLRDLRNTGSACAVRRLHSERVVDIPHGVVGLLFDQQFGLLPAAPVYVCALMGFWVMLRRSFRLALELLMIAVPYGLVVGAYQMWWGGSSSAARFLVPVLLTLAIPAGVWFRSVRSVTSRLWSLAGLIVSVLITITLAGADHGALLYNSRDGASRLLLWLSPLVNVTTGLPSSFQTAASTTLFFSVMWVAALAAPAAIALVVERRAGTADQCGAGAWLFGGRRDSRRAIDCVAPKLGHALDTEHGVDRAVAAIRPGWRPDRDSLSAVRSTRMRDELPRLAFAEVNSTAGTTDAQLFHIPAGTYAVEAANEAAAVG